MSNTAPFDAQATTDTPSLALALPAFVIAIVVAIYLQIELSVAHFWWLDELFSLWASEPSTPFATAFTERIAPDTNPPLYFTALYIARQLIADDRTAVVVLNILALVVTCCIILRTSARAHRLPLGLIGVALFILSGPVLRYTIEARAYLFALSVVFIAAWLVALRVTAPQATDAVNRRDPERSTGTFASTARAVPKTTTFVVLAALAAFVHVYAALACGALAAGLMVAGGLARRPDDIRAGFLFGTAATAALIFWILVFVPDAETGQRIEWLTFTFDTIVESAWDPKILVAGSIWTVALIAILALYALSTPETRTLAVAYAVAAAIFVAVPILISLIQPILHGRYWSIGTPLVLVFLLFAADRWWRSSDPNMLAASAATVVFFAASIFAGYSGAKTLHAQVWPWTGAGIVAANAEFCGPGSIAVHTVNVGPFKTFDWGFAKASGLPANLFRRGTPDRRTTPKVNGCRVLGWTEHVWLEGKSDRELLDILGLDLPLTAVEIRRHGSGYVVFRRRRR